MKKKRIAGFCMFPKERNVTWKTLLMVFKMISLLNESFISDRIKLSSNLAPGPDIVC